MGERPINLKPPAYLTPDTPVPAPSLAPAPAGNVEADPLGEDPTRFGDWTLKGIAIDF